jgi:tRNA pseudouridine32 synthase/23S rRNA pseudouridine746 synthase
MLFTCNPSVRGAYQSLFQQRLVQKTYHAIAKINPDLTFPLIHKSCIKKSENSFFIMQEVEGKTNSETEIKIIQQQQNLALYELKPITGRQHQLRVHMMSLGIPLLNDPFYPVLLADKGEDYSKPLQLLAKVISFTDPLKDELRLFESKLSLSFYDEVLK